MLAEAEVPDEGELVSTHYSSTPSLRPLDAQSLRKCRDARRSRINGKGREAGTSTWLGRQAILS